MEKEICYVIQEIFVEKSPQKRDEALKQLMNEYFNFIQKVFQEIRI